jgi:leader peptidase (prepilin peptidase)/N-methyltransferase
MVTTMLVVGCGLLGLVVGSFLNVVIVRVPRRQSLVRPRSRCTSCGTRLAERDNVPVVSWVLLRGRCRTCADPIPARYPLVELACGALFAVVALRFGWDAALPAYLLFVAALLAVAVIDLETFLVPNRVVYPALAVSVPLLVLAAVVNDEGGRLWRALLGALLAAAGLLVVRLAYPRGMGMGDVKLALLLGLALGWLSLGHVALGLFLGFLLGSVIGTGLVATGVRSRRDQLPFAPFLAAGAVVAVLVGRPLLDWYSG